jgi:hypothetical protein
MASIFNANQAIVEDRKITHYLLSSDHPAGRPKAIFFGRFGFQRSRWRRLRGALLEHARSGAVVSVNDTRFGKKYTVEGRLQTPSARAPLVRSIWFVRTGETAARLVTAYPVSGANQ